MPSFEHMSLFAMVGTLAVPAVGLLAFVGLIGLRLQRRGAARFWAAPAALALCLLPVTLGIAVSGLLLRTALAGLAVTGTGGVAAIAAGSAEALLATVLGLGVTAALTICAVLATALGSSKSSSPSSDAAAWAFALLSALAIFSLACLGALLSLVLSTMAYVNGPWAAPSMVSGRSGLLFAGSAALLAVSFVAAVAASIVTPRGPSGIGTKVVSVASLALCAVISVTGWWATWTRWQDLKQTALTGVRDGELPEPPQPPAFVEPPEMAPPSPDPSVKAVRVGGSIREPRKIRSVNPVYPEIAKQARVQGVVILEATISPRGHVTAVRVLRGIPLLDEAAIDAVKQWVYEPTLLNGVPVPVIMTVTVNYKLAEL